MNLKARIERMRASGRALLLGRIVAMLIAICLLFQLLVDEGFGELLNDEAFHTYASAFYVTQSDVSEPFSEEIGSYMDMMNEEYRRSLASFASKSKRKLHVRIYKTEGSYRRFTGEGNSVGVFMPSRSVLSSYKRGMSKARLLRVLRHEGLHQFMYAHITRNCPPWINEGLAEYFEYAVQEKEIFRQDVIPKTHVITLKKAMRDDSLLPLTKLLKMKTDEWNHNLADRSLALIQYAQSWSVVHFLICGNNGNRKDDLKEYLQRIIEGTRGVDGLEGFSGKRRATFEKEWMLHLEKMVN